MLGLSRNSRLDSVSGMRNKRNWNGRRHVWNYLIGGKMCWSNMDWLFRWSIKKCRVFSWVVI